MVFAGFRKMAGATDFQYSLCRVVLMVVCVTALRLCFLRLSVLALSSRFDGQETGSLFGDFQLNLSVLALSSRFDGPRDRTSISGSCSTFSTRSVESF